MTENSLSTSRPRPASWGAIWGALLLGSAQGLLLFLLLTAWGRYTANSVSLQFTTIYPLVLKTMIWGIILGYAAGKAWGLWRAGLVSEASRWIRRTGAICSFIHIAWTIYQLTMFVQALGPRATTGQIAVLLGYRIILSVPLQAAMLMLLTGLFLPKQDGKMVQVTENLRL